MKVIASVIHGIHQVDDFNCLAEVLSQEDFYEALNTLDIDAVIGAELDDDMTAKVKEEYGIFQLSVHL